MTNPNDSASTQDTAFVKIEGFTNADVAIFMLVKHQLEVEGLDKYYEAIQTESGCIIRKKETNE
jgi:hypothetical protein